MTLLRWLRASAAAVLLTALAVLLPLPAPTAQAASCSGVWEVVETTVRCTTSYASGLDALRGAGFSIQTLGSGFVCQIDGAPSTCTMNTPYWSYWHATRNADGSWGAWQYATRGASQYVPPAGSADGWSFGNGTPPAGRPPASATTTTTTKATSTTTTTTKAVTTTTTTSAASSTSRAATSTSAAQATGAPTDTPVGTSAAPALVTPSVTSGTATETASRSESAGPTPGVATATPAAAGGSPAGALAAAGVVVLGGAGLGALTWRARRR